MKITWNKQSVLLIGILTTILCIIGYYGYQTIIEDPKETYESSTRLLKEQQTLLDKVGEVEGAEGTLSEELDDLSTHIPKDTNPSLWMDEIKAFADAHQVTVESLVSVETPIETETDKTTESINQLTALPFELTVKYDNISSLSAFIQSIFELKRKTDITAVSYEQASEKEAIISLTTYMQPTAEE